MKITNSSSQIFLQCLSKLTTLNLVCLDNMQKLQFAEWQISDFWLGCHMRLYVETPAYYTAFFYYLLMFTYCKCRSWESQRNLFRPLAFSWTTARRTCNWRLCSLMSRRLKIQGQAGSRIFPRCACKYDVFPFLHVYASLARGLVIQF